MKKKELYALHASLVALSNIGGARFAYAVSKNKKFIQDELELVEKTLVQSDAFKEYEGKRVELCAKHSNKQENGEPVMKDNMYDIIDRKKFDKELKVLQAEYKEAMDEHLQKVKDYETLLEEDSDIEFKTIKLEVVPTEITASRLDPILFMIVE
jgi:hypothetical protein